MGWFSLFPNDTLIFQLSTSCMEDSPDAKSVQVNRKLEVVWGFPSDSKCDQISDRGISVTDPDEAFGTGSRDQLGLGSPRSELLHYLGRFLFLPGA